MTLTLTPALSPREREEGAAPCGRMGGRRSIRLRAMNERQQRKAQIFHATAQIAPSAERAAFLDRECAGDLCRACGADACVVK